MPKIGNRIIKSAIAVFFCFIIAMFRKHEGIVFYSCIAAVLCIQQDMTNSKKVAINRIIGTIIGGCVGIVVLFVVRMIPSNLLVLQYAFISLMIIPTIYITVLLKKTSASYISCVVLMSVSVSHGLDVNPILFAMNRMMDTFVGIFVAILMNSIHLPYYNKKNTLYVMNLDTMLLTNTQDVATYRIVKAKQMLERGVHLVLASTNCPGSYDQIVKDIPFVLPTITMQGAALYHPVSCEYRNCKCLSKHSIDSILNICKDAHVNCFVYGIIHHTLHIYYGDFQHKVEEAYYHMNRKLPFTNFIYQPYCEKAEVLQIVMMHKTTSIDAVLAKIQDLSISSEMQIRCKDIPEYEGYKIVNIVSKQASYEQAIYGLCTEYKIEEVCMVGKDAQGQSLVDRQNLGMYEGKIHVYESDSIHADTMVHALRSLFVKHK